MDSIYERLYNVYAYPEMKYLDREQEKIIDLLIEKLAVRKENRLHVFDIIQTLRFGWGIEAFALGIQLGEGLAAPYEGLDLYEGLLDLLAKFDEPVS